MQSGDYNQYFEIVHVTYITDQNGDQKPVDNVVYKGFAKVNNLSGREYWDAFSVQQENTLKFFTRWSEKFRDLDTTEHQIKWQGGYLDITAIDNVSHGNSQCIIKAIDREHSHGRKL